MISPDSKTMISPGTIYFVAIISRLPLLKTLNCGESIFLSSSTAFSALPSCIRLITVLTKTTPRMTKPSTKSFITNENIVATKSMMTIGSMKDSSIFCKRVFFFFRDISFRPYFFNLSSASLSVSPCIPDKSFLSDSPVSIP